MYSVPVDPWHREGEALCMCTSQRDMAKRSHYMNNHVHSAPQLERKKRTEKKERRITRYKIDNNLNGLEKYIFF